jgi:hypothetical protein
MKSTIKTVFIALLTVCTLATFSNAQEKQSAKSSWAELKSFHGVMSQTFHPAEEGDFKPIRERAAEMHKKAVVLAESKIPADFNNDAVIAALNELTEKSAEVEKLVLAKATDEELMVALSAAHDTFHKIAGLCQKGDHEKEEGKSEESKKS